VHRDEHEEPIRRTTGPQHSLVVGALLRDPALVPNSEPQANERHSAGYNRPGDTAKNYSRPIGVHDAKGKRATP
jgi:hypothetical protein